jgi:hypothetical protein
MKFVGTPLVAHTQWHKHSGKHTHSGTNTHSGTHTHSGTNTVAHTTHSGTHTVAQTQWHAHTQWHKHTQWHTGTHTMAHTHSGTNTVAHTRTVAHTHSDTHTHAVTHAHATHGRIHLDEGSARRRDLYLPNRLHSQEADINDPPVGFEPAVSASEWPQTHALDRAAFLSHCTRISLAVTRVPLQLTSVTMLYKCVSNHA